MMQSKTTTELGRYGEEVAAEYLVSKGYTILERNYRYDHREIDIIARTDTRLVFVEVKARTDNARNLKRYGRPSSAVTKQKQKLISDAAFFYMRSNSIHMGARIDVIEVYFYPSLPGQLPAIERIHHIQNAFWAIR